LNDTANKYNYVIGSGWWCASTPEQDQREKLLGSDQIRGRDFHQLWYQSVTRNCSPEKIIIVDSASPIKPELADDDRIEFVSLSNNAGHSTHHTGIYCGWTRSVLLGLQYAIANDADYFVYVEQDVLLAGAGIIEHCIEHMTTPYMFGSGAGTPQLLQQSFFIIAKPGMERFLSRLMLISWRDCEMCPEDKFVVASAQGSLRFSNFLIRNKPARGRKNLINRKIVPALIKGSIGYTELPIGFGRARPIDFSAPYFYFQHGSEEEIKRYTTI